MIKIDIILSKDDFWRHLEIKGYHLKSIGWTKAKNNITTILKVGVFTHLGKGKEVKNGILTFDLDGLQELAVGITGIPAHHLRAHGINHDHYSINLHLKQDYGDELKKAYKIIDELVERIDDLEDQLGNSSFDG